MRLPPAYCGLFLFSLLMAAGFGGAQVFGDPDTGWHLAAGDLIRQLGRVPLEDTWSYVTSGEIWYNLSWAFDVLLSLLFQWGGFSALYALTLLAFIGSLVLMADHCLKRGASIGVTAGLLVLGLLVCWSSLLARPNIASILFTTAFYLFLSRYRDRGSVKALVALPVLMAVWVNMHGGFLIAFPMLSIFLAEAMWQKNRNAARAYGLVLALCLAATALNPYGLGVYYGAYRTLFWSFGKDYLIEWQSAKIGHDAALTLLFLAMLAAGNIFDSRIALSDRLLAVLTLCMALSTQRHGPVAAVLMMPYLSQRLTSLLATHRLGERWLRTEAAVWQDMHKTDIKVMGAIMGCVGFALVASPFPRDLLLKEPVGFPVKSFPAKEAAFIEQKYPHVRFMTSYNLGGWLDYLWRGRVKVFVDGRASSLFSQQTLQDYADFEFESRGFGGRAKLIATQYQFGGVLIPHDAQAAADWHWNPDWRLVYEGDVASVYLRASPPTH